MNAWEYLDKRAHRRLQEKKKHHRSAQQIVDHTRTVLAFMLVGSFVLFIPLLIYKTIPIDNKEIIVYMMGQLSGMALLALGLYFSNKAGQEAIDEKKSENTAKLADAMKEQAITTRAVLPESTADVFLKPGETVQVEGSQGVEPQKGK